MIIQPELPLDRIKSDWLETCAPFVLERFRCATFTSDDLHDVLPAPAVDNWFGVLMAQLANAGLVERVGWETSRRKEANGRVVRVWRVSSC